MFYDRPKLVIVPPSYTYYCTCDTPKQSGRSVTKTVTPGSDDLTSKIRMTDTYPSRRTQPEFVLLVGMPWFISRSCSGQACSALRICYCNRRPIITSCPY